MKDTLYLYLFHYNPYTGYWNAFNREDFGAYFNGTLEDKKIIKHKNIKVLTSFITNLNK